MTELEFRSARLISARTQRPDTAFALLVALACVANQMPASQLAQLIAVHRSGVSLVAAELEAFGVLVRTWSRSENDTHRRGRQRLYALAPSWCSQTCVSTAADRHDRPTR